MSASSGNPLRPSADLLMATLMDLARPNPDAWIKGLALIQSNMAERQRFPTVLDDHPREPRPRAPASKVEWKINDQTRCVEELVKLMEAHPDKPQLKDDVRKLFPNVSYRFLDKAWQIAVLQTGAKAWSHPGRRRS
jgi:hypothetical protein